jgi:DNA helicase II / ATP-dependent DNA helicase PcrA
VNVLDLQLAELNEEQRDAATTIEGPVLVLAGAGSGKTGVLTKRVAHLVHNGISAENILAVTFTNKAAHEMKERITRLVGEDATEKLWVSTFHSTCARILRKDAEALGAQITRKFAIYDEDDQLRIVKEVITGLKYDPERVSAADVLSRIDHHKNRGVPDPDVLVGQFRSSPHDPLVRIWRDYEERLRSADAVDFNDLIHLVVRLLKVPEVVDRWQEKFQFVLVDEYQDTNASQYALVRALTARRRNLMVVGDDDQSIYGFRGADITNILNFKHDFPEAKVVRLERNYRSTGNILAVANAVVAKNTGRMSKELWTEDVDGHAVTLIAVETVRDEAQRVARGIERLRRQGHAYQDVAIIYRTNATSRQFEQALREARIPHRIVGGRKFFERREIRDVMSYIRLIVNPADDAAFLRVVNVPSRGIGPKTLQALRAEAAERGEPLLKTARARRVGKDAGGKAIAAFVELVDEFTEAARDLVPAELVLRVLDRTGYRAALQAGNTPEDNERLANLTDLVREASEFEPPPEAETVLEQLRNWLDRVSLAGQDEDVPEGGEVTLTTVHNAKGLEYPVVYVVQCVEGQFPHHRSMDHAHDIEEERRLAYVAFTRARKRLIVTRSRTVTSLPGPGQPPMQRNVAPSRFLYGLPVASCEGDLPHDQPADDVESTARLPEEQRERLREFLAVESARAPRPVDTGDTLRLVEIDDDNLGELSAGRRVHHRKHGVGVVRSLLKNSVSVEFAGSTRTVAATDPDLHFVRE